MTETKSATIWTGIITAIAALIIVGAVENTLKTSLGSWGAWGIGVLVAITVIVIGSAAWERAKVRGDRPNNP